MVTEADIMAEAARGEVVCVLYKAEGGKLGILDEEGLAKDELCRELCEEGRLRFAGWEGRRTSPSGMRSKWIKA